MDRKYIGFFSENKLTMADNGSINNFLTEKVNYDKAKVIDYLSKGKKEAICPKEVFDAITKNKLSSSFSVYTDGEYVWKSDLEYYIKNYNLILPDDFII
ncbi:MAG: hypothetical protein LUF33_04270, partial [Clostridiales bacterium]|nr:hypothetical protein [Clostridiales bacterium]